MKQPTVGGQSLKTGKRRLSADAAKSLGINEEAISISVLAADWGERTAIIKWHQEGHSEIEIGRECILGMDGVEIGRECILGIDGVPEGDEQGSKPSLWSPATCSRMCRLLQGEKAVFLTAYSKRRLQVLDEDIPQESRTKVINQGRQVGYQVVQQGIADVENDLNAGHEAKGQEAQDAIEPCAPPRKRRKSEGHIEIRKGSVSYHIPDVPFEVATPKKPKLRQQDIAALKDVVAIDLSNVPCALGAPSILAPRRSGAGAFAPYYLRA
ncbi:hypothetical protein BC832DRAFT_303751 [Gaertneriomyces semiglobifer]|nr:hypothetical protein BC832DRAFT_303751 [Gaertneriomyces semiglobifer]